MAELTFTTGPFSDASFVIFAIKKDGHPIAEVWIETGGVASEPLERLLKTFPRGTSHPLVDLQSALAPVRGLDWSAPEPKGEHVATRAESHGLRFAARTHGGLQLPA